MHATNAQEYVNRWNSGETVTSISMGGKGMGSGYEHAIQKTTIILLRHMLLAKFNINETNKDKLGEAWDKVEASAFADPEFDTGLSGAMFGAAQNLAAHFYRKGPAVVMEDAVVIKRHILVSKDGIIDWLAN